MPLCPRRPVSPNQPSLPLGRRPLSYPRADRASSPRASRPPSVLTCPYEAATHASGAPRASAGPGRASHRRGSAGAMPFPGPGARQRGFPVRYGEPEPFYSRRRETSPRARLGPPPLCPTPGSGARAPAQGPWPRARRSALLSALHGAASRVGPPRPLRWEGRQGPRERGLGKESSGSEMNSGTRGRGEKLGARRELHPKGRTRSALPSRAGNGLFPFGGSGKPRVCRAPGGMGFAPAAPRKPCAGRSRCAGPASPELQALLPREPTATPSRPCPGSWPPASLRLPEASCQKKVEGSPPIWRA